jgi:hypothetical protein
MDKRTTILLGLLAIGAMVALLAYPAVAGKDQHEQHGQAARRACGAEAAQPVAAAEAKSCGVKTEEAVASANGKKSCGAGAVASKVGKSCPARQMAGILASSDGKAEAKSCGHCKKAKGCGGCKQAAQSDSVCAKCTHGKLSAALDKLDAVESAVKSGDTEAALQALAAARKAIRPVARRSEAVVASADAGKGKAHKHHAHKQESPKPEAKEAKYVNRTCPIMGNPIQHDSVKPQLVRQHKGQAVAFCCGGCPAAWDRLSAEQKATKLSEAK